MYVLRERMGREPLPRLWGVSPEYLAFSTSFLCFMREMTLNEALALAKEEHPLPENFSKSVMEQINDGAQRLRKQGESQ